MNKTLIRDVASLRAVRHQRSAFDEIIIDTRILKTRGLMRHAFKYALWAAKPGGLLKIADEPSRTLLFRTSHIDFWQVRQAFFKAVGDQVDVLHVDDKTGDIHAQKRQANVLPDGVSFGIVFGGGDKDAALLLASIGSIAESAQPHRDRVEIIVCGPVDEGLLKRVQDIAQGVPVHCEAFDMPVIAGRVPLSAKKAQVFKAARHDAVVISHTRIRFGKDVVRTLLASDFEVLAPRIDVEWDGRRVRYLDYILVGGYDVDRRNTAKALGGFSAMGDGLRAMARRVPYVDGGVMIFNRRAVKASPFNPLLAWCEAEDVDACARAYQNGLLIDYDGRLDCASSTIKFTPVPGWWFRMTWPVKQMLIERGWY